MASLAKFTTAAIAILALTDVGESRRQQSHPFQGVDESVDSIQRADGGISKRLNRTKKRSNRPKSHAEIVAQRK